MSRALASLFFFVAAALALAAASSARAAKFTPKTEEAASPAAHRTIRVAADGSGDYKTLDQALSHAKYGDMLQIVGQGRVGLGIDKVGKDIKITYVYPGGAAEKAGIKSGDVIVLVNDEDISAADSVDVANRLRGPEGSDVRLQILSAGSTDARRVTLTRGPRTYAIADELSKANVGSAESRYDLMIDYSEKAANHGDVKAMESLASVYYSGWYGIPRDEKKTIHWLNECAPVSAVCARLMGAAYLEGKGVPKDLNKYFSWSDRAARGRDVWGERNLGIAYAYGYGTAPNAEAAESWLKRAAGDGSEQAARDLETWKATAAGKAAPAVIAAGDAKPAPEGPVGLTRTDIRQMMQEALREQKAQEPKPAAPAAKASSVDTPKYSKKERPDDLAVVIGIEKYASLPEASFAERDAAAIRAHLVALGYPERNIFSLTGAQATKSAFMKEIEARLKRMVKPDSNVFVYFSGHGAPDPKSGDAFLVPYDGDPEFLDETAYPVKRLYAKLGALNAKRVIVALDSCFSGAGGRSVLAKGARPLVTKVEAVALGAKVSALTAASGGEISGTLDEEGHGLFTYYLLKGLNAGDATLGALHGYLKTKVADEARRHNRDQTPQLIGTGAAEAALAP